MKERRKWGMGVVMVCAFIVSLLAWGCGIGSQGAGISELPTATSLDDRDPPDYDYTRANRLPLEMVGCWEKSFDVGGKKRTAKIYIPYETPIRSYYTVIAVPDGVDTGEFLVKSGWKDLADERGEGLFILEPAEGGWGSLEEELEYVNAAMGFYMSNRYFSIYGEHYLVGYGNGAPLLEAWAANNPLRVIAQVYVDSPGLPSSYFAQFYSKEFSGVTPNPSYLDVEFPSGFRLIRYSEVVLPTWFISPEDTASDSLNYWREANDCVSTPFEDGKLGLVYPQEENSGRWMTSYSGPISKVAVLERPVNYMDRGLTRSIYDFLSYYTRYENEFAYGNQLVERANYEELGIEIGTIEVNGYLREYLVYVPPSARELWGNSAPVLWVWAGNTQTDRVFLDATQWWKVAREKGFILVIPCEQYDDVFQHNPVQVTHKDCYPFFLKLKDIVVTKYGGDPTRFYFTGQSAGSMVSQAFAIAFPEYVAAVASTSGVPNWDEDGNVVVDGIVGTAYPPKNKMVPTYLIYGAGDLSFMLAGDLWDDISNNLDVWASYFLNLNGLTLDDVDSREGTISGWYDRFRTWTWVKQFEGFDVPVFKVTKNLYRSHNCIYEEMPMLWDFLEHYSVEVDGNGNIVRYYSPSAFKIPGDKIQIYP
ncbi:MAG: hypothetical protein H5T91_00165 [Synergistetes bacterium]|nr:hypothetical protein [Synergistota bacterium]